MRSDGSYRYQRVYEHPAELQQWVDIAYNNLKERRDSFEYGTSITEESLQKVDRVLALAKERGITIVGIMPPYPPVLYAKLMSVPDEYRTSVLTLPKDLRAVFSKYGFQVHDFTDAKALGASDGEFTDATHASDKLALRMLLDASKNDPTVRAVVDVKKMQSLLKNTAGDLLPLDNI
jgi:hypothetical protein